MELLRIPLKPLRTKASPPTPTAANGTPNNNDCTPCSADTISCSAKSPNAVPTPCGYSCVTAPSTPPRVAILPILALLVFLRMSKAPSINSVSEGFNFQASGSPFFLAWAFATYLLTTALTSF